MDRFHEREPVPVLLRVWESVDGGAGRMGFADSVIVVRSLAQAGNPVEKRVTDPDEECHKQQGNNGPRKPIEYLDDFHSCTPKNPCSTCRG